MDTALLKVLGFSPESLSPKLESRVSCLLEDFKNDIPTTSDVQEQGKKTPTMHSIYPEFLDFKSKETSYANACNIQSRWNRYFDNSAIVDIPSKMLYSSDKRHHRVHRSLCKSTRLIVSKCCNPTVTQILLQTKKQETKNLSEFPALLTNAEDGT